MRGISSISYLRTPVQAVPTSRRLRRRLGSGVQGALRWPGAGTGCLRTGFWSRTWVPGGVGTDPNSVVPLVMLSRPLSRSPAPSTANRALATRAVPFPSAPAQEMPQLSERGGSDPGVGAGLAPACGGWFDVWSTVRTETTRRSRSAVLQASFTNASTPAHGSEPVLVLEVVGRGRAAATSLRVRAVVGQHRRAAARAPAAPPTQPQPRLVVGVGQQRAAS